MRSLLISMGLAAVVGCSGGGNGVQSECLNIKTLRNTSIMGAKVTVDFNVLTCDGDPVPGLVYPGNFEIFEDGNSISSVTNKPKIDSNPQNFKVYTLMMVDVNMGIRSADPDLANVRASVKSFAGSVLAGGSNRQVAIYAFDGRADVQKLVDFTSDGTMLMQQIDTLLTCSNTMICVDPSSNLNGAIVQGLAALNAARSTGSSGGGLTAGAMAVFTDGVDRAGRVTQATAVNAIKASTNDNSVFTIAFESDQQDLTTLREYGRDGFVSSGDLGMLEQAFMTIAERVNGFANSNYRLQYCTTKRAGDHNLEVKVTWANQAMQSFLGFLEGSFKAVDSFDCTIN